MVNPVRKPESVEAGAEALLQDALAECDQTMGRLGDLLRLIDTLIAVLPPERRTSYLQSIERFQSLPRTARRDPINDNIIAFIHGKQGVKAVEVKEALTGLGMSVDQKRVANSLDYLSRRGPLQRIGRGEYRIDPAAEAEVERMLTASYGPPTRRGHPPGEGGQLPEDY
jgi:hypothetical protein